MPSKMKNTTIEKLEPLTIPLQDINLIEASAGTGKTYTITTLVLRLILERPILIKFCQSIRAYSLVYFINNVCQVEGICSAVNAID
jgi:hypothetical protein